jgi:HNH endonuclease
VSDAILGGEEGRPPIPTELRRRVLVEAGHRCSIPTCRYIEVDVHHIISWAQCQAHEYDNLIALCPNCHRRADRGVIDRKSLRLYKINLRFAHDKYSQLELDTLFELGRMPTGQGIALAIIHVDLAKARFRFRVHFGSRNFLWDDHR